MQEMLPHAYALAISDEAADRFRSIGLSTIVTDGAFFLTVLKSHLAAEGRMVPDERFEGIPYAWRRVTEEHEVLHGTFSYKKNPELLHCSSYQDGLIDAFGRIMRRQITGEYSCPRHVIALVDRYREIQRTKRSIKKYSDVAYVEGYINGLRYLVSDDKTRNLLPMYYVFGHNAELRTLGQYKRICRSAVKLHRAAYLNAVRLTDKLEDGVVFHHMPFLL